MNLKQESETQITHIRKQHNKQIEQLSQAIETKDYEMDKMRKNFEIDIDKYKSHMSQQVSSIKGAIDGNMVQNKEL